MIFKQGKDTLLNQNSGTLPNMAEVMAGWFQKMQFIKITKSNVNYKSVEVETIIDFEGVWDGLPIHKLEVKPEGQRSWSWYGIHAKTNLELKPDDKVKYQGKKYRVMQETDYSLYGYHEYQVVEDFV
jgi:hypothetical protein